MWRSLASLLTTVQKQFVDKNRGHTSGSPVGYTRGMHLAWRRGGSSTDDLKTIGPRWLAEEKSVNQTHHRTMSVRVFWFGTLKPEICSTWIPVSMRGRRSSATPRYLGPWHALIIRSLTLKGSRIFAVTPPSLSRKPIPPRTTARRANCVVAWCESPCVTKRPQNHAGLNPLFGRWRTVTPFIVLDAVRRTDWHIQGGRKLSRRQFVWRRGTPPQGS